MSLNWRDLGDVSLATYKSEFQRRNSPLLSEAESIYNAVKGYSLLYLAQVGMESEYATTGFAAGTPSAHNALGTKVRGGNNEYQRFASWTDGAKEWKSRILDPAYAYAKTVTLADYIHVYAPSSDGNDEAAYVAFINDYARRFGASTTTGDTAVTTATINPAVVFGNVKKFGYMDLQSEMANKPEGVGWDNLGKRDMLGIVLHRMWGTLAGTRSYFAMPSTGALTDFAVGVEAIDGKANAGVIQQYNDPFGYRSGWASGRVSAPYGDGLLFVNKYGVNAVNKRLTSLEISGYENTPIDDFAWGEIVHFVAYWADQCHIRWDQFPINPATGISFLFWHQEMTIGTGKLCPWNVVMSRTNELIEDVKAMLKTAQTGGGIPTEEEPGEEVPVPTPTYAAAVPILELAMMADRDFAGSRPYKDVTLANGKKLRARVVLDKVKVTEPDTFFQQYAIEGGKRTKPDPVLGALVDVVYSITTDGGEEYWIDEQWSRISQDKADLYED